MIEYFDYNENCLVVTNMYDMEEAIRRMAFKADRKLNTPVDKRTRFYKYLVEQGIVKDGETILNKQIAHIK
jgi:hypothetical protein